MCCSSLPTSRGGGLTGRPASEGPSASFPGETTVLNVITRKYDRGGYVDARTATYLYPALQGGTCTLQASLDTRRSTPLGRRHASVASIMPARFMLNM